MDRLRRECPWDQRQTHESLVRYLVEETYEVVDAIESGDPDHLREELGDLLLQVVFHARIASDATDHPFDIDEVATAIVDKMVARHPHVFAGLEVADAADVERNWEVLKAKEKARRSPLDGIPPGLPALLLAHKVISRLGGPIPVASMSPALATTLPTEAPAVAEAGDSAVTADTVGEALFSLVAAASAAGVDAEQALRARVRRELDAAGAAPLRALTGAEPQPS